MDQQKRERRDYDREFKMEAVKMSLSDEYTPAEVAENLGIPLSNLRRWIRQYRKDAEGAFPGKGQLTPNDEEMRKLQRENARLRQERDILKKALAIFSTPK